MIFLATIIAGRCSVKDLVVITDEPHRARPIVAFGSPVGVCLIVREFGQPGCELKEGSMRQSLLVIVPVVKGEDLPVQATATAFRIPTISLVIKNPYSDIEPGWGAGRAGKSEFGCPHGC